MEKHEPEHVRAIESRTPRQAERSRLAARSGLPFLATLYDAIIFDFDGVLANTERLHWTCWKRLLANHNVDLKWTAYSQVLCGYSGEELLARILFQFPGCIGSDQIRAMYSQKKLLYLDLVASVSIIPEAVVAFVQRLPVPCAVVTSAERAEVERELLGVGLLPRFAAIVCAEDVAEPKPAPDGYDQAMITLGVKRALAVEDSDAGVQSAMAAGLDVLRVPSPDAVPALVTDKLYGLNR